MTDNSILVPKIPASKQTPLTNVYVVTAGEYRIVAVFSSKETAEKLASVFSGYSVEEFTLDPETPAELHQGLSQFRVVMKSDGRVHICRRLSEQDSRKTTIRYCLGFHRYAFLAMCTTVWARDKEHAIKIANEKRTRLPAANLWRPSSPIPVPKIPDQDVEDLILDSERIDAEELALASRYGRERRYRG